MNLALSSQFTCLDLSKYLSTVIDIDLDLSVCLDVIFLSKTELTDIVAFELNFLRPIRDWFTSRLISTLGSISAFTVEWLQLVSI